MAGLIADVNEGKVNISETSQQTERKVGSSLGKEDFLQLLVTQMQYQDPLQPTDNTEYVSQLAQFSELENMQNLNDTMSNTSAFTLVGKEVYIEDTSPAGITTSVQGVVEYVKMENGKTYVSVDGESYEFDKVIQVIDDNYIISQNIPKVNKQTVSYRHHDPQDVIVNGIDLGKEEYQATGFAAVIVSEDGATTKTITSEQMTFAKNTLKISKEVFSELSAGRYKITLVFDDPYKTMDYDSVSLEVKGVKPEQENADNTSVG